MFCIKQSKRTLLIALLFLSLVLPMILGGCGSDPATNTTGATEAPKPTVTSKLYWNLEHGTTHKKGTDGYYAIGFACDGKRVTMKFADEKLVQAVEKMTLIGLKTDDKGIVTDYIPLMDLPYQRITWDYYVHELNGSSVKTNTTEARNGKDVNFEITNDTIVMDVSPSAAMPGAKANIKAKDLVTAVTDSTGKVTHVFITKTVNLPKYETVKMHCERCDSEQEFIKWVSTSSIPNTNGHYLLQNDVIVSQTTTTQSATICLDLNGKTIKQETMGQRVYRLNGATTFSVMDNTGNGSMIPASTSTDEAHANKWGMIFDMDSETAVLNLYSGTLDASNCKAQYGNAINMTKGTLNMYGGVIKGGQAYGTGSAAVRAAGTFNMYGGKILGGTNYDEGYISINIHGGATVRVSGTMNMYGGEIIGGDSDFNGGVMRILGTLNLQGGTISGGKCDGAGDGIFVMKGGTINVSGNVKVFENEEDNIYFEEGTTLIVGNLETGENGAKIGVSMQVPGLLSSSVVSADILNCFVSDNPDLTITLNGDGQMVLG